MSDNSVGRGDRGMKPIPDVTGDASAERAILPILPGNVQPQGFAFYAIVLPGISATPLYQFIADHWLALDSLTGSHTLLLVPVIPRIITPEYLAWWKPRLTPSQFVAFQAKLLQGLDPTAQDTAAVEAYRVARNMGIPISELPVMIVTSRPGAQVDDAPEDVEDILVPLDREWDESTCGKFFELLATACDKASAISDDHQRLMALNNDIDAALVACASVPVAVTVVPQRLGTSLLRTAIGPLLSAVLPLIVKAVLGH